MDEPVQVLVADDRPRRRRRWPFVAAGVALVAASLGGAAVLVGDDDETIDVTTVLAGTEEPGTARFRLELEDREGLGAGALELEVEGEVDFARRIAHTAAAEYEEIVVPGATYGRAPGEELWLRWETREGEGDDLGNEIDMYDPLRMLEELRSMATATEDLGDEEVRGVATAHARVTIDPGEAGDGPQAVDVWVDGDDRLRRLEVDMGEAFGRLRQEFWDFGVEVDLREPGPDEVRDDVHATFTDDGPGSAPGGVDLLNVVGPWTRAAAGDGVPGGWALWVAPGEHSTLCASLEIDGRASYLAGLPEPEADDRYEAVGVPVHNGNPIFCEPGPPSAGVQVHGDPTQSFDGVRLLVGTAGAEVPSVDLVFEDGTTRTLTVDPVTRVFATELHGEPPERVRLGGTGKTCDLAVLADPYACS